MPTFTSVEALLEHVEPLTHAARWTVMVELGRRAMAPPEDTVLQPLLVSLARSEVHYERLLATMSLRGAAGQRQPLPAPLADICRDLFLDPSKTISNNVREPLVSTCTDEQLTQLLHDAPARHFRQLCKQLDAAGRLDLVRAFAAAAQQRQDLPADRVQLLTGYASAADVLAAQPAGDTAALPPSVLARLTAHSPKEVVDHLLAGVAAARAAATGPVRLPVALEASVQVVLETLTSVDFHQPDKAALSLRLLYGALQYVEGPREWNQRNRRSAMLRRLLAMDAVAVATYLTQEAGTFKGAVRLPLSRRTWRALGKEPGVAERLLAAGVVEYASFSNMFAAFPAPLRAHVWSVHRPELAEASGLVSPTVVLSIIGAEERMALARAMYTHRSNADDPSKRLPYLAALPFPEAKTLATPFITDPDPTTRVRTAAPLVDSLRYHPQHLSAVLDHVLARGKEPDPYRQAVLRQLGQLPPSVWLRRSAAESSTVHLDKLVRLAQDTLDARDVSSSSIAGLQTVVVRMVEVVDGAAAALGPVLLRSYMAQEQFFPTVRLQAVSVRAAAALASVLVPAAQRFTESRKDGQTAQSMFAAFGSVHVRRLWVSHFRALADACLRSRKVDDVIFALGEYVAHDTSAAYIPVIRALLEQEPDAILADVPRDVVAGILQSDALRRALEPVDDAAMQGRFRDASGLAECWYIPLPTRQFAGRWTARQQNRYAATLAGALQEHVAENHERIRDVLDRIAAMPSIHFHDTIGRFVAADYPDAFTRDKAVEVMGSLQDAGSMAELMAALNDSRVGVASVAIQKRLRGWPTARTVALLLPLLLTTKAVGVHKQLIRCMGSLGDGRAFDALQSFAESKGTEMHPDVRLALVSAMHAFLGRREAWKIIEETATARSADLIALTRIPDALLRETWQLQKMNDILLKLLQYPDSQVQRQAINRLSSAPMRCEDHRIFDALLENISRIDEPDLVRLSLVCALNFRDAPLDRAVDRITGEPSDRALSTAVDALASAHSPRDSPAKAARTEELVSKVAERLIAAGRQPVLAARLVMGLPPGEWVPRLEAMVAKGLAHPGVVALVVEHAANRTHTVMKAALAVEGSTLRRSPYPVFRCMGLGVIRTAAERRGWRPRYVQAALAYQADPEQWIRDEAMVLELPTEPMEDAGESGDEDDG